MPSRASLNVSLTPELTSYVATLVATGRYRSASEVLRAALRALQRDEPVSAASSPRSLDESARKRG
jgi:antitoxin ParD1/3/4